MNIIKLLSPNTEHIFFNFVFVGAGANGSVTIRNFLQDARTHLEAEARVPYSFNVTLVDGDKVEKKNLSNQIFLEEDIDEYKVDVLADRYGEVYRLKVMRLTEYIRDLPVLSHLFPSESMKAQQINVLVGLVDNNRTRQLFDEFFFSDSTTDLIYIDAGVEGVSTETDEGERTGFSGQVVCGLKINGEVVLDPVGRIYANILEDTATSFPGESCGELIINHPQRSATNKFCAQIVNSYLNNLLHTQAIYAHYINFNAQIAGSRPTYISDEQYKSFKLIEDKN